MWVVMTSSAKMPSSCWGRYANVAVCDVNYYNWKYGPKPKIIRQGKDVFRVIHRGHYNVGKTDRCAYARAVRDAEALALQLNSAGDLATVEQLIGAGGSA